jgi:signal peptide peptidase SppA
MPDWLDNLRQRVTERVPTVAVLRLDGVISSGGLLGRSGLNLASLAGPIQAAFSVRRVKAVALAINSPGGSPVQSSLIAGRIRQLADEKKIPVYAFAEDVAASGGYWLATAADEIYADPASIVGSIGVISSGFGFAGLIERIGVERRLYTSGERKSFLDPFRPEQAEDVARLKSLQSDLHETFRQQVISRRGTRLSPDFPTLFSGEFWTGLRAKELGLVDGLGDLRSVMRMKFGDKVRLRLVGGRRSWLRRRLGMEGLAAEAAGAVVATIEERAFWARYGL